MQDLGVQMIHDVSPLNAHIAALPEVEQQAALVLVFGLIRMNDYVSNFAAAVALLEFSDIQAERLKTGGLKEQPDSEISPVIATLTSWRGLAARDAAMTLFHFRETLEGVRSHLDDVPTAKPHVDVPKLRLADKLFRSKSPHFEEIRHATAHLAELTESFDQLKTNLANGTFVYGRVLGKRYEVTINGHHYSFEVSKEVLNTLIQVTNMTYDSFPVWREHLPKLTAKT